MITRTGIIGISMAFGLLLAPVGAFAADATVVLTVHHADCVLCGPIVKRTLAHVTGVKTVAVSQADEMADVMATVTYDDAEASPAAMIKATTGQGYPAEISKPAKG
ncbi:MAG TPA: mercury transporter [Beijerinckiaceae bacterium]|nr:mercury transporter [Beijerinckiaceae bacterium]